MRGINKRVLSLFLALAMIVGMLPAIAPAIVPEAEAAVTDVADSYITMPITIRDFAADGMLFEFNQVGATGTKEVGGAEPTVSFTGAAGGSYNNSVQDGYVRYTSTGTSQYITWTLSGQTRTTLRYAAIKYRTNAAYSSQPTIGHRSTAGNDYVNFTASYNNGWQKAVIDLGSGSATVNYVSMFPQLATGNYIDIAYLSFFENEDDASTYNSNDGVVVAEATYNQNNAQGFSLLTTAGNNKEGVQVDYIHNLVDSSSIPGTTLIENGSWGLTTDPTPVSLILNSGAPQSVYGAWIRTDLVQAQLDADGKPIYTQAAVDYLADYMDQIFDVKYQEDDGTYNTYYVLGVKMFDENKNYVGPNASGAIYDLADIFRGSISSLGDYATAKSKFEAGNLSLATQATTWYEAAYFLLHNTWRDSSTSDNGSDGYGMPIDNYKDLHLVQTTNADGDTCYVFNSGYDSAVYDYNNGEIYNTQTSTITGAVANGASSPSYVRGNLLPDARFDPLGKSGAGVNLGYGLSGDTYGDMVSDSIADWADYYDETNYHLSLEGHAQFIYYEDANLYFTFTGDDDVYLYINGTRVLDVGAAHSISKVKIKLNDVAEMCGLQDGQSYDFDFFYMERHGTAANFGIETNIKIVDPAMTTTKEGFQKMVSTGYNGYVDPLVPVYYSFGLKNNGEAPIEDLTFEDETIGVYLSKDIITLNAETQENREYVGAIVYNTDGSIKSHTDNITDDALKALLDGELAVGEEIIVYGFRYTIPEAKWTTDNTFPNTVYTTAVGVGDNAGRSLNGMADWKVQKREYNFQDYHVYEWMGHGVTLTKDELLQPLVDAEVEGIDATTATIALSSASGVTTGVNVNTKAVMNSDGSITYTGTKTGADTFYYKVTQGSVTAIIGVAVYSYDVADNTYVLDYGLPVELNGDDFGLRVNDTLELADNPHVTTAKVTGVQDATSSYGDFTWEDPSLKYTPDAIINNIDTVRANVQVLEDGATELTKFTGVDMYETVTTAPASVVYYEDDFPGITYVNTGSDEEGNVWAEYVGANGKGTEQSADQNSNYGSDPNYTNDNKWGKLKLNEDKLQEDILKKLNLGSLSKEEKELLKEYMKTGKGNSTHDKRDKAREKFEKYEEELDGTASNGTIHELILNPGTATSEIMYFDFQGTGFELISRATQDLYAVLSVRVYELKADGTIDKHSNGILYVPGDYNGDEESTYRSVPVVTQSEGGDAYEVPIIKVDDLPYSKYRVALYAGNVSSDDREIYIDGIRIYEPLGNLTNTDGEYLEDVYYSTDEAGAEFQEIRPWVLGEDADGNVNEDYQKIVYLDVTDGTITWGSGTTVVEDLGDDNVNSIYQAATSGTTDYLKSGPNNEIYLDATAVPSNSPHDNVALLAFYVTKDTNVADDARTLQIGAHRKINTDSVTNIANDSSEVEYKPVYLVYGSTADAVVNGIENSSGALINRVVIESGTEQYITIDPANLVFDDSGKALVMVGTIGGENASANVLALTNLKICGYTLSACGDQITNAASGVATSNLIESGYSLRSLLAAPAIEDEPEPSNPDVSEPEDDLPDYSDPEETEPDETEPGETEPGETEPGETEPGETEPGETEPGETEPEETEPEETKPGNGNNNRPGNNNNKPGNNNNNKPGNSNNKPGNSNNNNRPGNGNNSNKNNNSGKKNASLNAAAEETVPVVTEPVVTEPVVTETEKPGNVTAAESEDELLIHAAGFLTEDVASGTEAVMYALVSGNTETLQILDEDGNEVEFTILEDKDLKKAYGLKSAGELLKQLRGGDLKKLTSLFTGFAKETAEFFAGMAEDDFDFRSLPEDAELLMLTLEIEGESGEEFTYQVFAVDAEEVCSEKDQSVTITVK